MRPSLFALYHNSESEIVDIDVYVLSANFMLLEETTFKITWSKVLFNNYGTQKQTFDYSINKKLYEGGTKRRLGTKVDGSIGIKSEDANVFDGDNDYYFRLHIVH